MKPHSIWTTALTGLILTAGLLGLGRGLADLRPMHHIEYLTVLVNCGSGVEPHSAWTEPQHVSQYSACLDRSAPIQSRSASHCAGNCGNEPAQAATQDRLIPDALRRWRL